MAIYGHMTRTTPTSGTTPPPEGEARHDEDTTIPELADFEDTLEKLNRSIDDTLGQRFDSQSRNAVVDKEEPHFTLATSPTRNMYKTTFRKDDEY